MTQWLYMKFGLLIRVNELLNTQHVTTLYKSLSYKAWCSQSQSSLRCLVMSSDSRRSSAPGLASLQAGGHLTPTSYSSDCHLRTMSANGSWSALYILGTDPTEKTSSNSFSVVAWHSYWHGLCRKHHFPQSLHCCVLHSHNLATTVSLASQF
jgi:hypothetical protein